MISTYPSRVRSSVEPAPSVAYAKFTKSTPLPGAPAKTCRPWFHGNVHDRSVVATRAPPLPTLGSTAAVHTSYADRNKLKSRTSRLFLPSRKRTLTAFAEAVEFTTDSSEL